MGPATQQSLGNPVEKPPLQNTISHASLKEAAKRMERTKETSENISHWHDLQAWNLPLTNLTNLMIS